MKSVFRLYARTSKGNDKHLFQELRRLGLDPYYQDAIYAFYFNATFKDLFDISFNCLGIESLYIQLGKRFPSGTEKNIAEAMNRIPFKNYLPIQRGLIENMTLNIILRQSTGVPSENVITSLLHNHLSRQIITKEYKKNIMPEPQGRIHLYKQIKTIVNKKWKQQDQQLILQKQQKLLQLAQRSPGRTQLITHQNLIEKHTEKDNPQLLPIFDDQKKQIMEIKQLERELKVFNQEGSLSLALPYNPYLMYYVRRNQGRILLKVNQQPLYKHGWKKSISWGAIRESIVASALHQSGLIEEAKNTNKLTLWDPFCGSSTIPLVASSILNSVRVRTDHRKNFNWSHWPVYRSQYLTDYLQSIKQKVKQSPIDLKILASDINFTAINHSIQNFRALMQDLQTKAAQGTQSIQGTQSVQSTQPGQKWINLRPTKQTFQFQEGKIYFACEHFESVFDSLLEKKSKNKVSIVTNLPYLKMNSTEHIQLNQLVSSYKKFDRMLYESDQFIENAFIFISLEHLRNPNHFFKVSKERWQLLEEYQSGGVKVGFYRWERNKVQSIAERGLEEAQQFLTKFQDQSEIVTKGPLNEHIEVYREKLKELETKKYRLPKHMIVKRNRGWRSAQQKAVDRHLKMAYFTFSKRRDKQQALQDYLKKKVTFKLMRRGLKWKKKSMGLLKGNPQKYQGALKKEFESRIQQAMEIAQKKTEHKQKAKRVW